MMGVCVMVHSSAHGFLQGIVGSKRSTAWWPLGFNANARLVVGGPCDPAVSSPARRPARFSEGLLVRVLLRMNLVVQEISRQLVAVIDLQLRGETRGV